MSDEPDSHELLHVETIPDLGEMQIVHLPGTFALTPASRIMLEAIGKQQHLLRGKGIDWGSGTGCLAIAAAKAANVEEVIGLELSPLDVEVARQNATLNGVEDRVTFYLSNSYTPLAESDQGSLETWTGQTNFIVANPPSSDGDDGFEFRRMVLRGARPYLVTGGVVFLNISYQYGQQRIENLAQEISGFDYGGLLASTDWVPFDLQRADLWRCLEYYVEEEQRGGFKYTFAHPDAVNVHLDAQSALADFQRTGVNPLTKWQTHLFSFGSSSE